MVPRSSFRSLFNPSRLFQRSSSCQHLSNIWSRQVLIVSSSSLCACGCERPRSLFRRLEFPIDIPDPGCGLVTGPTHEPCRAQDSLRRHLGLALLARLWLLAIVSPQAPFVTSILCFPRAVPHTTCMWGLDNIAESRPAVASAPSVGADSSAGDHSA